MCKCQNCGKEAAEGTVFCGYCGTKIGSMAMNEMFSAQQPAEKKMNKKKIGIIAGIAGAAAAMLIAFGPMSMLKNAEASAVSPSTAVSTIYTASGEDNNSAWQEQTEAEKEAEEQAEKEAEEQAQKEAEEQAQKEAEEQARQENIDGINTTLSNLQRAFANVSINDFADCFTDLKEVSSGTEEVVDLVSEFTGVQLGIQFENTTLDSLDDDSCQISTTVYLSARFGDDGKLHDDSMDTTITMVKENGNWLINKADLFDFAEEFLKDQAVSFAGEKFRSLFS